MIDDMRMRKLADKTQAHYIRAVRQFAGFLGRSPDTATVEDLRRYQLHLVDQGVSPISLNAAITGLKFFFDVTLDHGELMAKMQPVRVPRTLPVVLSREEVARLIAAARNLKHQTALSVAYGAGLRASEVVALKVGDIDSQRMTLRIEQGKGRKDRYAMLAPVLLERLRAWWRVARAQGKMLDGGWLFPGLNPIESLSTRQLNRAVHAAAEAAQSTSACRCIRCATASPRTCWSRRSISASSRCCSGTRSSRPRRSIRTWPPRSCAKWSARWRPCRPRRSAAVGRLALEVADIFRVHGPAWRQAQHGHLSLGQLKVMSAIEQCRSAALGGHVLRCEGCGTDQIAYNSCRNRHCPKCQASAAQRWLEARQADLLPVEYYHVVFTLPAPISDIAYQNKAVIYGLLFDVAAETLLTIAADPKHLGAQIGATLVLHTWGSALTHHPHVHGIVPGGGLSPDGERWVACRPGFFLPVRVLSRLFRRRFLEELAEAHRAGQLHFFGEYAALADAARFADWLAPLRQCEWVVYAKRPFAGPEAVLAYLSRYTHRVAISNSRLVALDERGVTFRWKDYRAKGKTRYKTMTLGADEFMRRFLLHVLPRGFHRIRHYGLLANGGRKANLARARELLQVVPAAELSSAGRTRRRSSSAGTAARRCSSSRPSRAGNRSARHPESEPQHERNRLLCSSHRPLFID